MGTIISLILLYILYRIIKSLSSNSKSKKIPDLSVRVSSDRQVSYYRESNSANLPKGKPARWYGTGETARIRNFDLNCGLVYVGRNLPNAYGTENDACLINTGLPFTLSESWDGSEEMEYWPHYGKISAKCRGTYLKWLAGGRSEPRAYIGYVFLFFYGLERRVFVDGLKGRVPENERLKIIGEVKRLLKIYGNNSSFRGYANNFLAMEWVLYQRDKPIPDYLDFSDKYCSEPFQVLLSQNVAAGRPIPADMALQWLILNPEFVLRTPARRCAKEFNYLFKIRYKKKFKEGLKVKPNKTRLRINYHAASPSVRCDLSSKIPDLPNPFYLSGPTKKLGKIAENCTVELESYSRFLARKENNPNSLYALSLLPKELLVENPAAKNLQTTLTDVCAQGAALTPLDIFFNCFEEKTPAKLGKRESEGLAALTEGLGFGLVPDVRFHKIKLNPNDKVVVFRDGHGVDFQPSREFRIICAILRLGAMVARIDDDVSPTEETVLKFLVQNNRKLTKIEKDSLLAFLYWCLRTPQGTPALKPNLSEISSEEKTLISHILISVAHADGRIDPKEVKQLEKLYTSLGLDPKQVVSDIHSLAASSEPVTVGLRDPETTFSIPKPTTSTGIAKDFHLNPELLRIIDQETQQAQSFIDKIFTDQTEEPENISAVSTDNKLVNNPIAALDEAHQKLLHLLLAQETWERSGVHKMCKELGLLTDGAMEVLNEWAFDNANSPLIEHGDPIFIDINLAKEIIDGE